VSYLPNAEAAELNPAKITGYLLNNTHPTGRHKADFFRAFGFALGAWETLAAALYAHPMRNRVVQEIATEFGPRWRVECSLTTPDGRNPCVVTIWQADAAGDPPRFITACPKQPSQDHPASQG
jgi:hypothetical protein